MSFALQNHIKAMQAAMQAQIDELKARIQALEEAQKGQRPVLTLKKPERTSNG